MENTNQTNCQCDHPNSKWKSLIRSLIDLLVVVLLVLIIIKMLFMSEWWYRNKKYEMIWRWEFGCECMMDSNSWKKSCGMSWCSEWCSNCWCIKNEKSEKLCIMMWDDDKKIDSGNMNWNVVTGSMTWM